ncbi:ABC transporter ATP-binding protein [Isoptericola halotolerans]|uniref:ABC transporter ATP-binding protein n=1 Tax=Isoptericola halotolerans TaxID=300560 RepID=UPI003890D9CD
MSGADGAAGAAEGSAVRTRGLTKRFRSGQVGVAGIDLLVPRGAVYGFLGPNGSGKTTTIRMLLGLVSPTSGSVELLGEAMPGRGAAVLPRVGALVEGPAFHPYLSGEANLRRVDAADATVSPATRARRIGAALERVGLTAAAGKTYRQYSLGMKQRLGLAAALLRPRDLLLLDEPTNGLDPQGTREVRALVREVADAGATVLVSSHLLSEIEQVCSHVGIMSRGELLAQGPREAIADEGTTEVRVATRPDQRDHVVRVLAGLGLSDARVDGGVVAAPLGRVAVEKVAQAVVGDGIDLLGLEVRRPTLEDVFVRLTGEGFDVAR